MVTLFSFIYVLLNDAVSISHYRVWSDRIINEQWTGKHMEEEVVA
jgi:hypothetical protein